MPIGPLPEQGLDEALGFPVGLWSVRAREAMAQRPRPTGPRKEARPIGAAVVSEQAPNPNPPSGKPDDGPPEKCRTEPRPLRAPDFHIGQPRRVVDRHVDVLPADPTRPAPTIAMDAMPDPPNPADAFDVEMEQIAGVRPLIALNHGRRLELRHAIQTRALEHARHRRARDAQRGTDLPRRCPRLAQRDDGRGRGDREAAWLPGRARRPVFQARAFPRQPLRDGAHAHAGGRGRLALRPALTTDSADQYLPLIHVRLRITMGVHSGGPPEAMGWCGNPHCFQSLPNEQRV